MTDFTGLYCTDEDVAVKAVGDYGAIIASASQLAAGTDGVFGSGNRWLLTSASNDFAAQGVPAGAVCKITTQSVSQLYVASNTTGGLTLRRLGLSDGQGLPPGGASGTTGIVFDVRTCLASISEATRWLDQRFRIPELNGLDVPTDLRRAAVLLVLIDLLGTAMRGKDGADNWGAKHKAAMDERDALFEVLDRTYGLVPQARRVSDPVAITAPTDWRTPPNW